MTLVLPEDWRPLGVDELEGRARGAIRETERNALVTAGQVQVRQNFSRRKRAICFRLVSVPLPSAFSQSVSNATQLRNLPIGL